MKAIEKLEDYLNQRGKILESTMFKHLDSIRSEVKELEAQLSKQGENTCESCKHHRAEAEYYGICTRNGIGVQSEYTWTCGGYEPKDNS